MESLFTLKILTDITKVGRVAVLCYEMPTDSFYVIGKIPDWIPDELANYSGNVHQFFDTFFHTNDKPLYQNYIDKMIKGVEFDWEKVKFKGKELNFTYISFYFRVYPDEAHPKKGYILLVDLTELREIEVERKMQDAISKQFLTKLESKNKIIEEQKQLLEKANADLKAQKIALEELNATKDKLFSVIGHDLRSPIHSIMGLMELLEYEIIEESEVKTHLTKLRHGVSQTSELLNNLLFWAKNQLTGLNPVIKPVLLEKVFADKYTQLNHQYEPKKIIFRNQIPKNCYVLADKDMLGIIVRNLLSNAFKFTPQAGTIEVLGIIDEEKNKIIIHITDNGVGIDEDAQSRLFGLEYYTTQGTQGERGAGLGLKLCQEFLHQNNSKLILKSEKNKGTCVSFELPLATS